MVCNYGIGYGGGCSPSLGVCVVVGGSVVAAVVVVVVVGVDVASVVVVDVVDVIVVGVVVVVRVVVVVVVVRFVVVVVVVGAGGGMAGPVEWLGVCTTAKMIAATTSTPSTPAALMAPVVWYHGTSGGSDLPLKIGASSPRTHRPGCTAARRRRR
jgi:hypothetical protein